MFHRCRLWHANEETANQIISNSNALSQVVRNSQSTAGEAKRTVRSCRQLSIKHHSDNRSVLRKRDLTQTFYCSVVSVSALVNVE